MLSTDIQLGGPWGMFSQLVKWGGGSGMSCKYGTVPRPVPRYTCR